MLTEVPAGEEEDKHGQVGRGGEGQGGQGLPPPSALLSANSDFSDPKFRISVGMVGQRVKPIYRHKFHT